MAVTVTGLNYTRIHNCDDINDSNATPECSVDASTNDPGDYREGTASVFWILKSSGDNDGTFTPNSALDLSDAHVRFWGLFTHGGLLNNKASGGIQFWATGGGNTGYWYLDGSDTYPGGWKNYVIDMESAVTAGSQPTSSNVTALGVRVNLTSGAKQAPNTWIDHLSYADGLIAYGEGTASSDAFSFEDIWAADNAATLGIGVMRKVGGVYFTTGEIQIGAVGEYTNFNPISETLIFEDRTVTSDLYGLSIVDDGDASSNTLFQLGSPVGATAGVAGGTIGVEDLTQTALWDLDGSDPDVDNFKVYGATISGADGGTLPDDSTTFNTAFVECGQMVVGEATVKNTNFISETTGDSDSGAILMATSDHNMSYCNFINNDNAIEISVAGSYNFNNMIFTDNTVDINNTSGGTVVINAIDSNPTTDGTVNVTINNSVNLTVTVKDEATKEIELAQVAIYTVSGDTELMNEDTDSDGIATASFNFSVETPIYVRIRKSSSGGTRYFPFNTSGTIRSTGYTLDVILNEDTIAV